MQPLLSASNYRLVIKAAATICATSQGQPVCAWPGSPWPASCGACPGNAALPPADLGAGTGKILPSNTVPQIGMSFSFMGSTARGSCSSTVKLAILPGAMLPSSFSFRHE